MKLDQETIVKHQFWFLLGGYLVVWLVAVLLLWGTAGDMIKGAEKKFTDASSAVKNAQGSAINTGTYLPPWQAEFTNLNNHKLEIWKQAWATQADMFDWPKELTDKYDMTNPQTSIGTDDKNNYKDKLYPAEIDYLRKYAPLWIDPVEFKDGFDHIFKPMTREEWKETPTREEMWLAQEDIWVKRRVFQDIYLTLLRQALMMPAPIDAKEPIPDGVVDRYRFKNQSWEITLNLRKNDKDQIVIGGDSTIKNIHPSRHSQPLTSAKGGGIWFNVAQGRVRALFDVKGEPVGWNDTQPFSMDKDERKDYPPLDGINWDKEKMKENPIVVSQGFDQTNSPIRRLNALAVGKQDCRTFVWPLQQNNTLAQLDAPADAADAGRGAAPTGQSTAGGGGDQQMQQMSRQQEMMKQMGSRGNMGGGSSGPQNATPNNAMNRDRYLQPANQDKKLNPPSRHLPLAFQLIVEQSHMHDVLLSLANSPLRFQTTQVDFRHIKDYQSQSKDDKKDGADTSPGRGVFGGAMPGYGGGMQMQMQQQMQKRMQSMGGANNPMMMMQNPGMMRGMGSAGMPPSISRAPGTARGGLAPTIAPPEAQNQSDDNLVEMTVYGIAILYRSPELPKTAEQPTSPGTPTPPAPTAAPPASTTPPSGTPKPDAKQADKASSPPPTAKQADKQVDQQKAPPPPSPPVPKQSDKKDMPPKAGDKR